MTVAKMTKTMTTKYLPINRSQWWGHLNNIFFKWNDNDNKIFWAITHSDGTILELDISFHSCFSRLCVSCLPSCIQYKCPSKIQFNTDGLPSCIWYKCYGTPPGLKSAPSFCSLSSSFYFFILTSCPPHPHFYHLISPPFDDEDENDNGERPWYDLHIQTFSIWERW